jgi:hypothetical protein
VAENSILFAAYGVCQGYVARALGVAKTEDLSTGGAAGSGAFESFPVSGMHSYVVHFTPSFKYRCTYLI